MTDTPRTDDPVVVDLGEIRAVVEDGGQALPPVTAAEASGTPPRDGEAARGGLRGRDWRLPPLGENGLPEGCPITPLGVLGDEFHFLDESNQWIVIKGQQMQRANIRRLLGRSTGLAETLWPKFNKDGGVTGWNGDLAADELIAACFRAGVRNPAEFLRGRGAWLGSEFELILHLGNRVWIHGREYEPGELGGYFYPTAEPSPRPAPDPQTPGPDGPGQELFELVRCWNWHHGDLGARLALGWIGSAMLGGALDMRPLMWLTGDKGTGKSTFENGLVKGLFGNAMVGASDASAAGIWQKVGHASLPVVLDEVEPEADGRTLSNVIKLARQAATSGLVLRGGQDHNGSEFKAHCSFLFSSILVPPLLGQDFSRMAILPLEPLARDAAMPDLSPARLGDLGARVLRLLADGWPGLRGNIGAWRLALLERRFDARGADVFGTLLAFADTMLGDGDDAALDAWAARLEDVGFGAAAAGGGDGERCLQHLLTTRDANWKANVGKTIGSWAVQALTADPDVEREKIEDANEALGTYGLKIHADGGAHWLAVANDHQGLARIFEGTQWQNRPGADGVWVQSLRRIAGARAHGSLRFTGTAIRCTLIPAASITGGAE